MIYIVTNAVPILLSGLAGAAFIASLWRSRDGGIGLLIATLAGSLWLAAILAGERVVMRRALMETHKRLTCRNIWLWISALEKGSLCLFLLYGLF